jgi:hypothetical protein
MFLGSSIAVLPLALIGMSYGKRALRSGIPSAKPLVGTTLGLAGFGGVALVWSISMGPT